MLPVFARRLRRYATRLDWTDTLQIANCSLDHHLPLDIFIVATIHARFRLHYDLLNRI
jgi:hypothetical protein